MARVPTGALAIIFGFVLTICVPMPPNVGEASPIESKTHVSPCRSLKRVWKEDGSCGKCMDGYIHNGNEQCIPKGIITVSMHEYNAFIPNGSAIILRCEFDTNETCSWKRGDSNIASDDTYIYTGPGMGKNTKDCSLKITEFRDFDVGNWICRGLATSDSNGRFGTHVYVSNEVVNTAKNNETVYITLGEAVVLKCYFFEPVNCAWHRDIDPVEIADRYRYISTNSSGCHTKDCSIKIERVEINDMVTWRCESMATSSKNATVSSTVYLRQVNQPDVNSGPNNTITKHETTNPKIYISNPNVHDEFICILENVTSATELHWRLDGREIRTLNRKLQNPDNGLFDMKISLNLTSEQIANAFFLRCIADDPQRERYNEINVADLKLYMFGTKETQVNSSNLLRSTGTLAVFIALLSIFI